MPRPRLEGAMVFALLFVTGCANYSLAPDPLPKVSPEENLTAPGMIPAECERLLQKSQEPELGYRPGEKWRPKNDEQAFAVAEFFSTLHLVPENSALFYRSWLVEPKPSDNEKAKERLDLLARAQSCDSSLALGFLEGVIDHRYSSTSNKKKAGEFILRFVLNQQARSAPLVSRAVSVYVTEKAKARGMLSGSSGAVQAIRTQLEKERAAFVTNPGLEQSAIELEEIARKELSLSEIVREQLSRHLPLP